MTIMTAVPVTPEPVPPYWTERQGGEPAAAWATRMAARYAASRPGSLARLTAADIADDRARNQEAASWAG